MVSRIDTVAGASRSDLLAYLCTPTRAPVLFYVCITQNSPGLVTRRSSDILIWISVNTSQTATTGAAILCKAQYPWMMKLRTGAQNLYSGSIGTSVKGGLCLVKGDDYWSSIYPLSTSIRNRNHCTFSFTYPRARIRNLQPRSKIRSIEDPPQISKQERESNQPKSSEDQLLSLAAITLLVPTKKQAEEQILAVLRQIVGVVRESVIEVARAERAHEEPR